MSDTGISITELFQLLKAEHDGVLLLDSFRKELFEEIECIPEAVSGWRDAMLDERGAAVFMRQAIHLLEHMAVRSASSATHPVYGEATMLAQAIHAILAERYGFQPCIITIMSPTERLANLRN